MIGKSFQLNNTLKAMLRTTMIRCMSLINWYNFLTLRKTKFYEKDTRLYKK